MEKPPQRSQSSVIDVVDIDPDIVTVAKKFFEFREDYYVNAHVADGREFVEKARQPYDVMLWGQQYPGTAHHRGIPAGRAPCRRPGRRGDRKRLGPQLQSPL